MNNQYRDLATQIARQHNIPENIFHALITQESGWNPAAKSSAGAIGLTQLMPPTAHEVGVNPFDPVDNLRGGAKYLSKMLDYVGARNQDGSINFDRLPYAYAAYNAGPGRVKDKDGNLVIPNIPETRDYVRRNMAYLGSGGMPNPPVSGQPENVHEARINPTARAAGYEYTGPTASVGERFRAGIRSETLDNAYPTRHQYAPTSQPGELDPVLVKLFGDPRLPKTQQPQQPQQPQAQPQQQLKAGQQTTVNSPGELFALSLPHWIPDNARAAFGNEVNKHIRVGDPKKDEAIRKARIAEIYREKPISHVLDSLLGGSLQGLDSLAQLAPRGIKSVVDIFSEAGAENKEGTVSNFFKRQIKDVDDIAKQRNKYLHESVNDNSPANIIGNILSYVAPGMGVGKAARVIPGVARLTSHLPNLARAAGGGATLNALMEPSLSGDFAGDKISQSAIGALGGVGGHVIGGAARRVLAPVARTVRESVSGASNKAMEAAKRLGVIDDLNLGQRTDNRLLRAADSIFEKVPTTQGRMQAREITRQMKLNSAAMRSVLPGQEVDNILKNTGRIDAGTLGKARELMSAEFGDLTRNTTLTLDNAFVNSMNIIKNAELNMVEHADKTILKEVEKMIEKAARLSGTGNNISGDIYKEIRSGLADKVKEAFTAGKPRVGRAINKIIDAWDDVVERQLPQDILPRWRDIRTRYRNLIALENPNVVVDGNINAQRLAEVLKNENPKLFSEGKMDGPLADIAYYSDAFKPQLPNASALENLYFPSVGLAGFYGGLPVMGGSLIAPYAAQRALYYKPVYNWLARNRGITTQGNNTLNRLLPQGLQNAIRTYEPAATKNVVRPTLIELLKSLREQDQ
jgi:hypothetical protein